MKKATNTRRTPSNATKQEIEEHEPPSISSKHVTHSFCRKYENYYLSATRYVSKSKKEPACESFIQTSTRRTTTTGNSANDYKQMPSNAGRNGAGRPSHTHAYWGSLISGEVFDCSMVSPKQPPTLPHPTQRRKTCQRLQRENQSATTIQAMWRGYRVRRELDEMNKAATRIQAAYRGHRTRQQLPLGFYSYFGDEKFALNQKRKAENKATAAPATSACLLRWGRGLQAPSDINENEGMSGQQRERHNPRSSVIPRALVFKTESSFMLSNDVLALANSLPAFEDFQAMAPQQQNRDAASNIQAARRGHQSRKELSKMEPQAAKIAEQSQILAYSYQLRPNSHENYQISQVFSDTNIQVLNQEPQDAAQYPGLDPVVRLGPSKESRESNAESNAPSIRNINVHAVLKSLPASKTSSISLQVSSPNAAVEELQRGAGRAQLRGLYTVRGRSGSKPSQICVQVNVVEMERTAGGSSSQ